MIPAPECFDVQVGIFEAMERGDEELAERLYREILPLVTFLMQSVPQFICYGKRDHGAAARPRPGLRPRALPAAGAARARAMERYSAFLSLMPS